MRYTIASFNSNNLSFKDTCNTLQAWRSLLYTIWKKQRHQIIEPVPGSEWSQAELLLNSSRAFDKFKVIHSMAGWSEAGQISPGGIMTKSALWT